MSLPPEGLYAEVLRPSDLLGNLQQTYRLIVAGRSTLVAIVNSLQIAFRTLTIEQLTNEVWQVLAAVKTEFEQFGEVLGRVKWQLNTATKTIEDMGVRIRAVERKLRDVEELLSSAAMVLGFGRSDTTGTTNETGEATP